MSRAAAELTADYLKELATAADLHTANSCDFPEVAARALEQTRARENLDREAIVSFILHSNSLPQQVQGESDFAEPSVTLYRTEGYSIEVNFWLEATTAIHQHAFAGAFCVLEGESIHLGYSFHQTAALSADLVLGVLRPNLSERLQPGAIRTIQPGRAFIHSLFHLSRPSVTLVIRTVSSHRKSAGPPFIYFPPGLGIDPFAGSETLEKQWATLDFLRRTSLPYEEEIEQWIERRKLTASGLVRLLLRLVETGTAGVKCRRAAVAGSRCYPELGGVIEPVVDRLLLQRSLANLRVRVRDEEGRLLLALLMMFDDRPAIGVMLSDTGITDVSAFLAAQVWRLLGKVTNEDAGQGVGTEVEILKGLFAGAERSDILDAAQQAGSHLCREAAEQIWDLVANNPLFGALMPQTAGRTGLGGFPVAASKIPSIKPRARA